MSNFFERQTSEGNVSHDKILANQKDKGFSNSDKILYYAIKIVEAAARSFEPDPTLGNLFDKKVVPEIRKRLDSETNAKINKLEARLDRVKRETKDKIWNLVKEANIPGLEIGSYVEKAVNKIDYLRTMDKKKIEVEPPSLKDRIIGGFKRLIGMGNSARRDAGNMDLLARNNNVKAAAMGMKMKLDR